MMKRSSRLAGAVAVAITFFLATFPATAQPVTFDCKLITITVATTPGGGYDIYARRLAQYLPKYLPGSPRINVRNMPGAGGVVLANHLYNLAPKDGTEIAAFEAGTAFTPILNGAEVSFEPSKFGWLGSLDRFVPMIIVWRDKPFYKFEDVRQKPLSTPGSGVGSTTAGYPYSLNAFLGTKLKVVNGYPGSAESILAMERGEVDGYSSWCWDCLKREKPHWVPEGHVRVLAQLSFTGDPELSAMGVPSLAELATTPEQKDMLGLIFAPANFGRPFVAPPGLPTPVLGAWREAFRAAAHDAGLAADLEKARSVVRYDGPEVVQKLFATADALDAPTLDRLRAASSGALEAKRTSGSPGLSPAHSSIHHHIRANSAAVITKFITEMPVRSDDTGSFFAAMAPT